MYSQPGLVKNTTIGSAPAGGWVTRNAAIAEMAMPTASPMLHQSRGRKEFSVKPIVTEIT